MAGMTAESASSSSTVKAPSTCPAFPGSNALTTAGPQALVATSASLPALLAHTRYPAAGRAAARLSQIRTRAGRGPPAPSCS